MADWQNVSKLSRSSLVLSFSLEEHLSFLDLTENTLHYQYHFFGAKNVDIYFSHHLGLFDLPYQFLYLYSEYI